MFQVKPMRASDFPFATKLANTVDWNMATEDFQFMTNLEPAGCFVAFHGRERVGISTSVSFGKVGWFGNLIVKEEYRNLGVGTLLVNHAVSYLKSRGVETIGLYAYPNLTRFYSNLGFRLDEDFSVLCAETLGSLTSQALPSVRKPQTRAIEELDNRCFGGDRKKLLESIIFEEGNLSYFKSEGNEMVGYVAATVYQKMAWVGPLICREGKVDVAVALLRAVLANLAGKSVYTVLPKKETILVNMLFSAGFKKDFSVSRMFLGQAVAKNCIYMAESLERG
jgi:GNAT superfamily N-acetyltransferase